MYALFIEVSAQEEHKERARELLNRVAVPMAREGGAKLGVWLEPMNGRGISITAYDTEAQARERAQSFTIGERPFEDAPEGVTIKTVEVREVIASL